MLQRYVSLNEYAVNIGCNDEHFPWLFVRLSIFIVTLQAILMLTIQTTEMNKFFLRNILKAVIAAALVLVMWIFQYYPESVTFKFWLGFVVVIGILCYMIALVWSLAKKAAALEKDNAKDKQEEIPEK